jgi:ATP-dependent DNA helicase RecG
MQLDELLVLRYVREEREITTPEAATIMHRAEPDARSVLESLVEDGLLERRGERRGRTYHLSATLHRELGQPAAYVRRRGFGRIQMESMIMQYVQAYGRITRAGAMELCGTTANGAYYVLTRLTKSGKLRLIGTGRAARYEASRPSGESPG